MSVALAFSVDRTRKVGSNDANTRFREIVLPHLGDGLALARWLTASRHDAEDVVQDACIRALAAMGSYEGRGARAWFLSIVRNTCFTWLAKNRPKDLVLVGGMAEIDASGPPQDDSNDHPNPEAALLQKLDDAAVQAAIEALPHPFREVVVLRDVSGLSYKEIAAMLATPIGTIMSRLARGRALLVADLERRSR